MQVAVRCAVLVNPNICICLLDVFQLRVSQSQIQSFDYFRRRRQARQQW